MQITQDQKDKRIKDLHNHLTYLQGNLENNIMFKMSDPQRSTPTNNMSMIANVKMIKETEDAIRYIMDIETVN